MTDPDPEPEFYRRHQNRLVPYKPPPHANPKHQRFVLAYVGCHNVYEAAKAVGLPPEEGSKLLGKPAIQQAIAAEYQRSTYRARAYLDDEVRRLVALRDADPNELIEVRRVNCRHCHGHDHEHQFDDLEYRHERARHLAKMMLITDERQRVPFDELGGAGFNRNAAPNPNCPRCSGDGELRVIIKDTRNLSLGARLLWDGNKIGPNGQVEVKFRDRSWATDRLLRVSGALNDRRSSSDPSRLTDEDLVDAVVGFVERGVIEIEGSAEAVDDDADLGSEEFREDRS